MPAIATLAHRALTLAAPAGRVVWSRRLRVLAFHGVPDRARFDEQVAHLSRFYSPVSLEHATQALTVGEPLPRRAVLVTFDDGERNVMDNGVPVLADRGVPAAMFVVAGLVGTEEPFWWDEVDADVVARLKRVPDDERRSSVAQLRRDAARPVTRPHFDAEELRELERSGVAIGNHSLTHPCLDQCGDDAIVAEVVDAHARLTDALGHGPTAFAYPNGNTDDRVVRAVADAGYRVAFVFDHKLSRVPAPDPLRVSRIRVNANDPIDRFVARVSGVHPFVHSARGG